MVEESYLKDLELIYPVGNTHLSYYEDVLEEFEKEDIDFENSKIMTVGSDLIGWWLKGEFPKAEVTTVEANLEAAYFQNLAGYYLSDDSSQSSIDEVKNYLGIENRSNRRPGFLNEDNEIPSNVRASHQRFLDDSEYFDEIPSISKVFFAFNEFCPEVIDEIGFETRKPDNTVIGDLRNEDLPEADVAFTNNVVDKMSITNFIESLEENMRSEGYFEMYASRRKDKVKEALDDIDEGVFQYTLFNPNVDLRWTPEEYKNGSEEGYDALVALSKPL
ncbi:MAG: hypothetical protein V5A72_02825 [Candidatus Nanohaloarchaea archaeon]